MANLYQIQWNWVGFPGAPGYTNLFYLATGSGTGTEALAAATKSRLLWDGVKGTLNNNTTLHLNTDVRVVDETNGDLVNIFTVSGITDVVGLGSNPYAAPAGWCIDWLTTTLHGGKRIQGRTFGVPAARDIYQSDGSIQPSAVLDIANAAEAMRTGTGPAFHVWGRPRPAVVGPPPKPAVVGVSGPAVSSRVPDRIAVLRSRQA